MPSHLVTINYSRGLEWLIPDSKMDKLIKILEKYGDKHEKITSSHTSALPYSQTESQS
jgi:hypothetical protein